MGPEITKWGPSWGFWLNADWSIKKGETTLEDYEGGKLPGEEPPEKVKEFYDLQVKKFNSRYSSKEYMELCGKVFDFYAKELVLIGTVGMAPSCHIYNKRHS